MRVVLGNREQDLEAAAIKVLDCLVDVEVMVRRRTPQEKKVLSYQLDGRNTYGENDKSSRKSIRRFKRRVNRTYRHAVKQQMRGTQFDDASSAAEEVRRKDQKKVADSPLVEALSQWDQAPQESALQVEARRRLRQGKRSDQHAWFEADYFNHRHVQEMDDDR